MSSTLQEAPEAQRRRMIAERQQRSIFWRVVHLLGSLKLALVLLATIAIACAIATFYESSFNAKIAQAYIYKAPWFIFWLGILCVNLFSVTLTRWPWQKKHTGFIVTHYGIIILLIGAVIGSHYGFEGNVILQKEAPPLNRITTSRSILQVESPADSSLYVVPFDASVTMPSQRRPRSFIIPGTQWRIQSTDSAEHLVEEEILTPMENGPAGVRLILSSATANRSENIPLILASEEESTHSLFGMATIALLEEFPEYPTERGIESQMVFAKYAPVIDGDRNSGVLISLSEDGSRVSIRPSDAAGATYALTDLLDRTIPAGNSQVTVREYWPDLELKDGKPVNRSPEPNNPAILVQVEYQKPATDAPAGLRLELKPTPERDGVLFRLLRDGRLMGEGTASPGETFATGWNDWEVSIAQILPGAESGIRIRPGDPSIPEEMTGIPGFLAFLDVPGEPPGPETWVRSGDITTLASGSRFVRIGYGLELRPVPFSIRLLDFDVPRYEGTQQPSNFIATVEFRDPQTGERKVGTAKMNSPASWPGGLAAQLTGFNYKFSQAEWNPQNLEETTLQVLYDPGWLLKWFGSLAICAGIGIMFYWKPRGSKTTKAL